MSRHLVSLREYARSRETRKLPGGSLRAVQKAIASGRISTVADGKGRAKIDPEVADIQWNSNTDPDQSMRANSGRDVSTPTGAPLSTPAAPGVASSAAEPSAPKGSEYWEARTAREQAEAEKSKIELRKLTGSLVDREAVKRAAYESGRLLRDMILAVPGDLAMELAVMTEPRDIEIRIRDELRKALDQVARVTSTALETRIG